MADAVEPPQPAENLDRKWAPGDAPWPANPHFTRKEAAAALQKGHPPMTPAMVSAIAAAVLKGESPQEIAERFGYAKAYASRVVNAPDVKDRVRSKIAKAMESAGLTLDDQIGKLKQLQAAEKVVTASKDGVITDEKVYADNGTRMRALEAGLELHGAFPHKRQYGGPEQGSRFVIQIAPTYKNVFFGKTADEHGNTES